MGVLLAKFKKEKSTEEVLEDMEGRIQVLENYMHNTEEQKKKFVGNFLYVSIGFYVITIVIVYFRFYPTTWKECLLYFVPLMLVPFLIYRLRRVFTWYFQRKLNKNSDKLFALRAEKRKILEQVMDKETYKVAVNLLARFGDKSAKPTYGLTPRALTATSLRLRNVPSITSTTTAATTTATLGTQMSTSLRPTNAALTPRRSLLSPSARLGIDTLAAPEQRVSWNKSPVAASPSPRALSRHTPFPIINQQEKSVFEKLVDILIGDGPQDRFAMICKKCYAHNGMVPKEEYEYAAFRCAFCSQLNPARKERPVAPRLSMPLTMRHLSTEESSSDEEETVIHRVQTRKISEISRLSEVEAMDISSSLHSRNEDASSGTVDDDVSNCCDNNNESVKSVQSHNSLEQKPENSVSMQHKLEDKQSEEDLS